MKQISILIIFSLSFICIDSFAQISYEPITIVEKGLFKKKFYKRCDVDMTGQQLVLLFNEDPNMSDYSKKLGLNYLASTLLKTAAVTLVLWPVTQELANESDPDWNLAYIGAGCALLSLPFTLWYNKKATEAIEFYNAGYKNTSGTHINLGIGSGGAGLVMTF